MANECGELERGGSTGRAALYDSLMRRSLALTRQLNSRWQRGPRVAPFLPLSAPHDCATPAPADGRGPAQGADRRQAVRISPPAPTADQTQVRDLVLAVCVLERADPVCGRRTSQVGPGAAPFRPGPLPGSAVPSRQARSQPCPPSLPRPRSFHRLISGAISCNGASSQGEAVRSGPMAESEPAV